MLAAFQYLSGGTVLIVDDEIDLCLLMKTYFLRKGCRVFIAHTRFDALEQATKVLPDVIIIGSFYNNEVTIVDDFLERVPDVRLITYNNQVIYENL